MDYIEQARQQILNMTPELQEKLMMEMNEKMRGVKFIPNAGPQTQAYFSPADEILYGGSAGCVSGDTEFMTPNGWKRIDQYKDGDLVGMIHPEGMKLSFVNPEAYINEPCEKMFHFTSPYLSMVLSDEHRCLIERKGILEVKLAGAIEPDLSAVIPVNFEMEDNNKQSDLEFAFRFTPSGDTIKANSKLEADYIQFATHCCGRIATIHESSNGKYIVRMYKNKKAYIGQKTNSIKTINIDRKYCFTLPTGFWLARHDDKIFITGNSGKSGLILGLAFSQHKRSLIMRRKYTDLEGLTTDAIRLFGDSCHLSGGSRPKITTNDKRIIDFGACRNIGDEQSWQGIPHDALFFDEVTHFAESQYRFLQAWLRTVEKNQRTRIVSASNPPTSSEGEWVIKHWAPWLDPNHSKPAKPGELRWFVTTPDGTDMEVPSGEPILFPGRKEPSHPKSRTFIPGKANDNPYVDSAYKATLDSLPEPLRSAMRDGNFMLSRQDSAWQLIPTPWVDAAISRWERMKRDVAGVPLCTIAADVCQAGGMDRAVISKRHDGWYDKLIVMPGKSITSENDITAEILRNWRDDCDIVVDCTGGYGTHTAEQLKSNNIEVHRYVGSKGSDERSVNGNFRFPNTRSAAYWKFREALDPSQPGGSQVALPNDTELRAELTAPLYSLTTSGFRVEPKEEVKIKLGRSPDKADSVVMAWWKGKKGIMPSHPSQVLVRGLGGNSSSGVKVLTRHTNGKRTRRGR